MPPERAVRARFALVLVLLLQMPVVARAEWMSREEAIMGTRVYAELWDDDAAHGAKALDAVMEFMRHVNALMSHYLPYSELSLINARAGVEAVPVAPELFDVIQKSVHYSEVTDGAFDITYASVGYLYDYRRHVHPTDQEIKAALPAVDYRSLILDPSARSVRFGKPGMRIDLGGIAKGWAADRSIEMLRDRFGITNAIVTAGGDSRILGDRRGKPWVVAIRDPFDRSHVVTRIPLADVGVSTSGDYEHYFDEGGVRYHHILDPKTGKSPTEVRSVTIIGPTATDTEGFSKGVFIKGPVEGLKLIERNPGLDAVVIDKNGAVTYSKGLEPPPARAPQK
jgi:thiamine biosynthesis lipoprotein